MSVILITGASGFIGTNMARYFGAAGHDVIGIDQNKKVVPYKFVSIDLLDQTKLEEILCLYRPDVIIHCAGSANVAESVNDPSNDFKLNVTLTHNLLFTLHRLKMEGIRVVFLSSAGVYGNPNTLPISEEARLNPMSPYAVHKLMCEELCQYFVHNYGMNIKIARVFSAYGAGLKKQIFWDIYQKYINTGHLKMFGTGAESRDYIYVDDVVQAINLLSFTESEDIVFNVANGREIKISEAVKVFSDCLGISDSLISFDGQVREGDPLNWEADISKIKGLGYITTVDLTKGLRKYTDWIRNI